MSGGTNLLRDAVHALTQSGQLGRAEHERGIDICPSHQRSHINRPEERERERERKREVQGAEGACVVGGRERTSTGRNIPFES
jgi:hypothetical protein